MKSFTQFLSESPVQFTVASFPLAFANMEEQQKNERHMGWYRQAFDEINAGIAQGAIMNPVYVSAKGTINNFLDAALRKPEWLCNAVWRENREKMGFTLHDLDTVCPYANTIAGRLKRAMAAKPKSEGDKLFLGWLIPLLQELAPLAVAVTALKDKVVKKQPKPVEDRHAKYVAPMATHATGQLILKALSNITNVIKGAYADQTYMWLVKMADDFAALSAEEQDKKSKHPALMSRIWNYNRPVGSYRPGQVFHKTLVPDYKTILRKDADEQAEFMQQEFLFKNAKKLGAIIDKKGVGLTSEPKTHDIRVEQGSFQGDIDFEFADGSAFMVRNKVVTKVNHYGTWFRQYPTTFHNVTVPGGKKLSTLPSEENMVKVWAVAR